jgi:hypothetical protein
MSPDRLSLSQDERDVLIASHRSFDAVLRLEAAGRLMDKRYAKIGSDIGPKVATPELDVLGRRLLLLEAIEVAGRETDVVGVYRRNEFGGIEQRPGRRRVDPHVPTETPWPRLFDFLSSELERRARKLREEVALVALARRQKDTEIVIEDAASQPPRRGESWPSMLKEIKAELLGIRWRHGEPLQYVAPQPVYPEPFYDAEGEIPPWTADYRKARAAHYKALKFDKPGEEEVEMGTTAIEIRKQLDRIEAKVDRIEAEQSRQLQEQLAREVGQYLEEVDD